MTRHPHLRLLPRPAPRLHPSRILVVVQPQQPIESLWALTRAKEIARAWKAELDVLAVLPVGRAVPQARRIDQLFGTSFAGRLFLRMGHATRRTAEIAREIDADLIVVGVRRGAGGHWARLARRLDTPVIVARPRARRASIVAATDFTDDRFPVLATARAAAGARDPAVLLLHNVDPAGRSFTRHFGFALGECGVRKLRDMRAEKLHAFAQTSGPDVHAILSGNADPVSAIDEHAIMRGADLVVVGAHRPLPVRRSRRNRTADRVIERVPASTLVIPLPPHELVA